MQIRSLKEKITSLGLTESNQGFEGENPFFVCKESKFPFGKKKEIRPANSFSDKIPLKKDGNFTESS